MLKETPAMKCKIIHDASQWGHKEPVLEFYNDYYAAMIPISKIQRDGLACLERVFEEGMRARLEPLRWLVSSVLQKEVKELRPLLQALIMGKSSWPGAISDPRMHDKKFPKVPGRQVDEF